MSASEPTGDTDATGESSGAAPTLVVRGGPVPTDEEAAAIVAAHEALWPRPVVDAAAPSEAPMRWRFSGRWWSKPVPTRRDRPWPTR
ncbi:MAG: hypothetical protein S0880_22935 [Actinomycetota bacterium]|nr:hypothetical protein [Actinomycetota bacterium]